MSDGQDLLSTYWGKANSEVESAFGHHTVLGHSLDVAACAYVLIKGNDVLEAQLARNATIAEEVVAITVAGICALHDIGKLDTRFQRKAPTVADSLRPHSAGTPTMAYDHGIEGFRQVESDEVTSALFVEVAGRSGFPLLRAVCGHHGSMPASDEPNPTRVKVHPDLRREDRRAREAFIRLVVSFFRERGASLPWQHAVDGPVVQRIAGLCAVADWIGSDVDYFSYRPGNLDLDAYWAAACGNAWAACHGAGLLRAKAQHVGFADLFLGYHPRDVQKITEALVLDEPALVIVEAEMGKGKTEAAFSMAASLLRHDVADGITVALPTMATSNAMFARVEEIAPRLFAPGVHVQMALAHGRASRHPGFRRLAERSLLPGDADAPEASVMCARWLMNKKRILLAQMGVGTIDQALQAALVVRHQFVRMFGLSRNVVIIDEVHAYDAYMEVLLDHLVRWLGALRVPVILLSATLPSERRRSLTRAWQGRGEHGDALIEEPAVAEARPYPLVTVATGGDTNAYSAAADELPTTRTIAIERSTRIDDEQAHVRAVASRLVEAARGGARVVWIRNTVREAQRAFMAVDASGASTEQLLFHSRFRFCDRSEVEQEVLARFGKSAPTGGRILIATQVVEQSLDLDFDEMHTDLAPVDLLLQRIGRLHRHDRTRPPGFESPRVVVHVPTTANVEKLRFGPSKHVYDVGTLWIANHAIGSRDQLELPKDIRPLIEQTYHPATRGNLLAGAGSHVLAEEEKLASKLRGRRANAQRCCIPPTTVDVDGMSTLDDDDDAVQAFTRDGQSTTLLPLAWDGRAGGCLYEEGRTSSWSLDPASSQAWRVASEMLDQTLSIPAKHGAEGLPHSGRDDAWNTWMRQFARFARACGIGERIVPLPLTPTAENCRGILCSGGQRDIARYTRQLGLSIHRAETETTT